MRVAVKYGLTANQPLVDESGDIVGQEAGPVLVRRLLRLFEPAILVGPTSQRCNGFDMVPLEFLDANDTLVINMDVIDSTGVWGVLHSTAAEPKLMNFVWWSASQNYHHRVNKSLLGLTFALFPTFANSERTASEVREIMRMWTTQPFVEQAKLAWVNLGVRVERVQPRHEPEVPVVLYPAIYCHDRKKPWEFIDIVEKVNKQNRINVQMRLHEAHLISEPAMAMSRHRWAWVGPLRTREGYWEALAGTTAFLATAQEESYGLEYIEALLAGVIGVFPDAPWARAIVPEGYPFFYNNEDEAVAMLNRAVTDTEECRAELDRVAGGSFHDWIRETHDDDDFERALATNVKAWFGEAPGPAAALAR
ncbi:MAG: glycosyltransferase family 1 protein [Propionibacteriaceae bacterium]|nr:glycosyltransferase family 1 protein [Propionibacteriaceae bacterium]